MSCLGWLKVSEGLNQSIDYLYLTFFLLDQKEPKNQDKPDPSGRFVRPLRTWVDTVLAAIFIQYYLNLKEDPSALLRMTARQAKTVGKRRIQQKRMAERKGDLQGSHPGAQG